MTERYINNWEKSDIQQLTAGTGIEILQNQSRYFRNDQKLLQFQIKTTSAISKTNTILTIPIIMVPSTYAEINLLDTNNGVIYPAMVSGQIVSTRVSIPSGLFLIGTTTYI